MRQGPRLVEAVEPTQRIQQRRALTELEHAGEQALGSEELVTHDVAQEHVFHAALLEAVAHRARELLHWHAREAQRDLIVREAGAAGLRHLGHLQELAGEVVGRLHGNEPLGRQHELLGHVLDEDGLADDLLDLVDGSNELAQLQGVHAFLVELGQATGLVEQHATVADAAGCRTQRLA